MRASPLMLFLGVLSLTACSDDTGPGNGGGGAPPPATESVDVEDNQFVAAAVRVREGGTVNWTWRGNNPHNVTFNGGTGSATQTDGTFERTFATAGNFSYICTIHGQSIGGLHFR